MPRPSDLLLDAWRKPGILAWSLFPLTFLSRIYLWLSKISYALDWQSSTRLPVPVLVVGIAIAGEAPFEAKKGVKRPAAVVLHQWLPANYAEDTVPVLHERLLLAMRQAQAAAAALL